MLCHRYTRIITRLDDDAAVEIADLNSGTDFNEHFRRIREVFRPSIFADHYIVIQRDIATLYFLTDHVTGHHLG
ncbi:Uncharacterised protein [Vibrio cholerae]|nr:Uncharacterised protein [Vibrio cholerae]